MTTETSAVGMMNKKDVRDAEDKKVSNEVIDIPKGDISAETVPSRTSSLRKRKPAVKRSRRALKDHISEHERNLTALSGTTCRTINCKLQQSLINTDDATLLGDMHAFGIAADGFHVKSGHVFQYAGELVFPETVDWRPSSMCPSPQDHVLRITRQGHVLPLACPTSLDSGELMSFLRICEGALKWRNLFFLREEDVILLNFMNRNCYTELSARHGDAAPVRASVERGGSDLRGGGWPAVRRGFP
ncbi:hypothetical protein MAR_015835 [Mya arenaria]|uniref:Uncharacterized protein n=1 Tax=Mya arenaria TaxID=6604 RepID=A0ABY7FM98_MYAAR|nr:hypothetical protein MAR_015835 [Mya arenaria]